MKSLFFSFSLIIFSGIGLTAAAQSKNRKSSSTAVVTQVKFIEGIEINRAISKSNEPAPVTIKTQDPVQAKTDAIEKCVSLQFKYAQLLNRNVESIANLPLYNFIENWWEVPYQFGGMTKSGIDCSGFVCTLYSDVFKKEIPRNSKEQYNACEKIERENLREADLVFFNTRGGVSHVGVYLGDGYFIHASTTNGIIINNLDDDYYSARFLGGGRVVRFINEVATH